MRNCMEMRHKKIVVEKYVKIQRNGRMKYLETVDLYYLYDLAYAACNPRIFQELDETMLTNQNIAIICKYACEYYLHWDIHQVLTKFNKEIRQKMLLENLIKRIRPSAAYSVAERDIYLYKMMYPEELQHLDKRTIAVSLYQSVLSGKRKQFPHGFFTGSEGAEWNSLMCLIYALQTYAHCKTPEDCTRFMKSRNANAFLRQMRLYEIMRRKYRKPINYVTDALNVIKLPQQPISMSATS